MYVMENWHYPGCFCSPVVSAVLNIFRILANLFQTENLPTTSSTSQLHSANPSTRLDEYNQSAPLTQSKWSKQSSESGHLDYQNECQTEPDLLYLNILNDAVKETPDSSGQHTTSNTPRHARSDDRSTRRNYLWTKLPQLDDIDNEYLIKKGVFDLPPLHHL